MKQLSIIGNIGFDAIIRENNGSKFVSFSVAVNERWKDQQGNKHEATDWISCTSRVLNLAQHLKKGGRVFCQGQLKVTIGKDREQKPKAYINLNVTHLEFLGSRRDEGDTVDEGTAPLSDADRDSGPAAGNQTSDDLPF